MILWLEFFCLMVVIFFTGKNLVKYGDILAEKLNLGRTIIGLFFIASITSLPELITGISATVIVKAPDLLAGDIFGSCMANIFLLSVLDAFVKQQPITTKVHHGFTLSASFGILLISTASLAIVLGSNNLTVGWVSVFSFVIIAVYMVALRLTTNYERRLLKKATEEIAVVLRYKEIPLKNVVLKYSINAAIIVVAASLLPERGEAIIRAFGLSETFFGSFFIAITTSLPELAVSVAAIKLNLFQIAVANLLGSNIFNIFIFSLADFLFTDGSIFSHLSYTNLIPSLFAILMTSVVIVGLIYKVEKKFFFLGNESVLLIFLYITGIYLTYIFTR